MPTNKEWLFSLSLDELYAWFDAEHVDAQRDNNGTCPDAMGQSSNGDSREKLEADAWNISRFNQPSKEDADAHLKDILELLDRQDAITQVDSDAYWAERDNKEISELQEQVDELTKQRDYWKLHADLWAEKCKEAERERELYRARVSDLLDAIQGAWRIGQLEYTLVDMDGEVVS